MNYKVLDLEFSAGINPYTVAKALGVSPATVAEYYAGYTSDGDLLDITGNGRTLTDSGSPTTSISTLMDQDRNHLQYYALNGSSQLFSAVHSEWMNMFDADFTIVLVVKSPSSAPVAEKMLLCHGETNVSGLYVSMDTSGYYKVYASKAASSVNAVLSTNKADDYWHVIHIVRSSTSLNIYVDATVGTSADPTTFGIDVSETFYLGSYKGPANYWPGGWLYARLQTTAMSTDALSRENAMWKGIAGGRGGCSHQVPTYTRAEASLAERVTGSTAVVTVNPNWPAKTPDGGMLVQGTVSQILEYTSGFNKGTYWQNALFSNSTLGLSSYINYMLAADASLQYILRGGGGGVRLSTDGGATFNYVTYGGSGYDGAPCAVSYTGQYMVLTKNGTNDIYYSNNYGANGSWSLKTKVGLDNVRNIKISQDGQDIICIAQNPEHIIVSNDGGTTWNQRSVDSTTWADIAITPDGSYYYAMCGSGLYCSTDRGVTWNKINIVANIGFIACSADGSIVARFTTTFGVYISTNYGVDFGTAKTNSPKTSTASGIAMDDTGQFIVATFYSANNKYVFISNDWGETWIQDNGLGASDWHLPVMKSDGSSYLVTKYNIAAYIYKVNRTVFLDCSVAAETTLLAPDGSTNSYKFIAGTGDLEHGLAQTKTLSADYYTLEADATAGNKSWLYLRNRTVADAYAYFHLPSKTIGAIGAGCTASINSYRSRAAINFLGTAADHVLQISPANANGDVDFAGDGSTPSIYVWEASCHLGKFQTLPMTRSTAAVTRSADSLTYPSDFIPGYFVGNSYQKNTLTIEVRVKCQYTDTNNIGANTYRPFLTIGGNTGTATATRNHISIRAYNQYVYASLYTDDLTATHRYMRHTVADANQWHTYKLYLDFTDLSASTFTKDDVAFTPGESADMSSTNNFDATNGLLRIGQQYDGTVTGFCEIDYIKIWVGTA